MTIDATVAACRGLFERTFGAVAAITASAPGRVNLIGEHTDYSGGFVLPIAIDRACVVCIGASTGGMHEVAFESIAGVRGFGTGITSADGLVDAAGLPIRRGESLSYVAGVVAQVAKLAGPASPVAPCRMAIASSVPLGAGLSSSASLEVATATALVAFNRVRATPLQIADACRKAEHAFAGVPCGIMDQFISAMGRAGTALMIDCRDHTARHVPMPSPDRAVVVVINTNVRHELAGGEYASRRASLENAARKLGVLEMRDATLAGIAACTSLTDDEHRAVRHVVTENSRTLAAADALAAGDLVQMGSLMVASHESLRDDYRVSCEELDFVVDEARRVPGVFGARMTGGGFGGCAIAIAAPPAAAVLAAEVGRSYQARFGIAPDVFATSACEGARVMA